MNTGYTFRLASRTDVDELYRLEQLCFGQEAFSKSQFIYLITKSKAHVALLLDAQKLAGYLILLFRKNSGHVRIYSVAVSPREQGKGLGRQLLNYAEQIALTNKKEVVTLEVSEKNQPAISLYQKWGFDLTGEKPQYYKDRSSALLMEKRLC